MTLWPMIREIVEEWRDNKFFRLAAALSFYTFISLVPLLMITLAIAAHIFGPAASRHEIVGALQGFVGEDVAGYIQTLIKDASRPKAGLQASAIGVILLYFGASRVFWQLQDALNTIWGVQRETIRGARKFIERRLLSFLIVLLTILLLLVSPFVSGVFTSLHRYSLYFLPQIDPFWKLVNMAASLAVAFFLFSLLFKALPNTSIRWNDVWFGAAVTAILVNLGKYVIGIYLRNSHLTSAYGVTGSLMAILLWIYYAAQILLLGSVFTSVYTKRFGSRSEV